MFERHITFQNAQEQEYVTGAIGLNSRGRKIRFPKKETSVLCAIRSILSS